MNVSKMPAKGGSASGGKEFRVQIKDDRCKGCAICVEICPKQVLAMSKEPMASGYLLAQAIAKILNIMAAYGLVVVPEMNMSSTNVRVKVRRRGSSAFVRDRRSTCAP